MEKYKLNKQAIVEAVEKSYQKKNNWLKKRQYRPDKYIRAVFYVFFFKIKDTYILSS
jgi:hypothetical protein